MAKEQYKAIPPFYAERMHRKLVEVYMALNEGYASQKETQIISTIIDSIEILCKPK